MPRMHLVSAQGNCLCHAVHRPADPTSTFLPQAMRCDPRNHHSQQPPLLTDVRGIDLGMLREQDHPAPVVLTPDSAQHSLAATVLKPPVAQLMIVPLTDQKCGKQGREKAHGKGSRATDAPSGFVGGDYRRTRDGGPEFVMGGVNIPALRSADGSGLSRNTSHQVDSGSGRNDLRDFALMQFQMIVERVRLHHDMGAGAVRGVSVLTTCKAFIPPQSNTHAAIAASPTPPVPRWSTFPTK